MSPRKQQYKRSYRAFFKIYYYSDRGHPIVTLEIGIHYFLLLKFYSGWRAEAFIVNDPALSANFLGRLPALDSPRLHQFRPDERALTPPPPHGQVDNVVAGLRAALHLHQGHAVAHPVPGGAPAVGPHLP